MKITNHEARTFLDSRIRELKDAARALRETVGGPLINARNDDPPEDVRRKAWDDDYRHAAEAVERAVVVLQEALE